MAFTKVVGAGIHTLSNITSHNVHSSGIITATRFDGPFTNLNVTGVTTFGGNVSIAGTLTYEDVTNIDSIGIVTAREGIDLPTDKKILLGDNDKFTIYKSSSPAHAIIENAYSAGSYLRIGSANGVIIGSPISHNQAMIRGYVNGRAELYFAGSKKIETTTTGVKVTGTFEGASQVGIQSGGVQIGAGITQLNFIGLGNTFAVNGTTVDVSISGNAGAGGTWSSYTAGIATTKSVGVNTNNIDVTDLVGVGNSFQGLYISNGMMIMDNTLNGNHYIGTTMNGLMAGPVNIDGTLTVDGNYVVV